MTKTTAHKSYISGVSQNPAWEESTLLNDWRNLSLECSLAQPDPTREEGTGLLTNMNLFLTPHTNLGALACYSNMDP